MSELFLDRDYLKKDYTDIPFPKGEYDSCTFRECNFNVSFINSKLLGANFSVCNPFMLQVRFRESVLNLANFISLDLQNTPFIKCNLSEVDFTGANLTASTFDECNLKNTIFSETRLEKVNFETSFHFMIDPTKNKLKGARFLQDNLSGLVSNLGIIISEHNT